MKGSNMNLHLYVTKMSLWQYGRDIKYHFSEWFWSLSKMSLLTAAAWSDGKKTTDEHMTWKNISLVTTLTVLYAFQLQFIQNLHNLKINDTHEYCLQIVAYHFCETRWNTPVLIHMNWQTGVYVCTA
jgi:hypothetical protein